MDEKKQALARVAAVAGMAARLAQADHVDVVVIRGDATLRQFVATFLGRRPVWLRLLYRLRAGLALALGLAHPKTDRATCLTAAAVPMEPGAGLGFFTVAAAVENRHWVAVAEDKHLQAYIAILAEPQPGGGNRFAVATVVVYRNWAGPVYFNCIRPFHHLIVDRMARLAAGVADQTGPACAGPKERRHDG